MDQIKKRKLDENGLTTTTSPQSDPIQTQTLTQSDARTILEPFTADQLRDILTTAIISHSDILASVRAIADRDVTQRKLFIRGLGWETTSDSLRSVFAPYGELEEAVVILDKQTGKSKGYGFVIFKHIDGAMLALKQSSKMIDGRIAVAALASAGLSGGPRGGGGGGGGVGGGDTSMRKIFVGNVPQEMPVERLLSVFSSFGEIEEGPLGFDKATGKSKGFAMFVYKTVEGAQAALIEPMKVVDGRPLNVKLASDGKKGKLPGVGPNGESMGMQAPPNSGVAPGGVGGPYGGPTGGGPGGYASYTGYSGMGQNPNNTMNPPYNSSVGGQGPGGYGGNAGYGGNGGYGTGAGYGAGSQYSGGPNSGSYAGYGGAGTGGAGRGGYGMPPNAGGPPSGGGYSDGGPYGPSAGGYPSQQYQPTSTSPAPRGPPGGAGGYSHPPPYY